MEILGIGTDIIEIERIARAAGRGPRFINKVFTQRERDYCLGKKSCDSHLAARFSAKEAVGKAIGRPLSWQDVEMVNDGNGKPHINLYGEAKKIVGDGKVFITVSHSEHYATAVAMLVKEDL